MLARKKDFIVLYILLLCNTGFVLSIYSHFEIGDGDNDDAFNSSTDCIVRILKENLSCGSLITFVSNKANNNNLLNYIARENCYSLVIRTEPVRNWLVGNKVYVIWGEDLNDFSNNLYDLSIEYMWNPRARFIFYVQNFSDLEQVFAVILKYHVYDVVLISNYDSEKSIIYTYFPFKNDDCGKKFEEVIKVGECGKRFKWPRFKEPEMKNCTLLVAAVRNIPNVIFESDNYTVFGKHVTGLEQHFFDTASKAMGITVKYIHFDGVSYGFALPNHTATGILGMVQSGKVTACIGSFGLINNRIEVADYISGYSYLEYYFYTPVNNDEIWKTAYREFGTETWVLLTGSYAFFFLITVTILLMSNEDVEVVWLMFGLYAYFCGQSCDKLLKIKKVRAVVTCWIWLTFFAGNFYTSALFSLMTGRVKDLEHIDIRNISRIPYKPCIKPSLASFMAKKNRTLLENRKGAVCNTTIDSLDSVVKFKDSYTIGADVIYQINKYKYVDEDGQPKINVWKSQDTSTIVSYITKGYVLRDKLQRYAYYMTESGLLEKHLNVIYLRSVMLTPKQVQSSKVIQISDLKNYFILLFGGSAVAFVCFLFELASKSCRK